MTKNEIEALKDLSLRDNIIITKADKGGTVVITDNEDYISESNQQLNNAQFNKEIQNDRVKPTEKKSTKQSTS